VRGDANQRPKPAVLVRLCRSLDRKWVAVGARSGVTHPLWQLFFYLATVFLLCVRACSHRAGGSFLPPASVSRSGTCFPQSHHYKKAMPLAEASPLPEQRAPCHGALFLAVVVAAKMGERQASSRPAMWRREGGGASNAPLLHPTLAATTTRPPGSLSCGQSRAMSCCRWCSGCMHAKSSAWSSSSPYFA
jgi:hypothetical protein